MELPINENDGLAQEVVLRSTRRPLTPAPSEGPTGASTQSVQATDPTVNIGQEIKPSEVGRGAPLMMPTPRPFPMQLLITPAMYINPNHYLFPLNLGGRLEHVPLASIPQGRQLAYALREDWRRPASIMPDAVTP